MRISDWSSDVCSSDLNGDVLAAESQSPPRKDGGVQGAVMKSLMGKGGAGRRPSANRITLLRDADGDGKAEVKSAYITGLNSPYGMALVGRSEEHTSELQSLMRISYAVFCLKKTKNTYTETTNHSN